MTEDEEDGEDGKGEDEGLFTVVDSYEAREAMERRERQRRCKETTDPEQEAVNATMGMSFVCTVCDGIHYPDKKPVYKTNKRGRTRMVKRPLPEGCENMVPKTPDMSWTENDTLTISMGKYTKVPEAADNFKRKPYENEDLCVALADINGYVKRKREDYLATRRAALESLIKEPFACTPRATRIVRKRSEVDGETGENHTCANAKHYVSEVYIGEHDLGETATCEILFPVSTFLKLGAGETTVLDLTEDFMMLLLHVRSKMEVDECRKNAQDVYIQTRRALVRNPSMEIFHEHYLLVNTNAINRDCAVYGVPETVVTIKEAVKLVDGGKARRVR